MKKTLRIAIADDHETVRKGLRALLETHAGWSVCAEASDGRAAVRVARQTSPDVMIVDLTMPLLNGLDATRQIRKLTPPPEVLILTMHHSEQLVHEVMKAGARGYVLKSDSGRIVVDAIEALSRHQPFFTPAVSAVLLGAYLNPEQRLLGDSGELTPREREIVQLIAEGRSSKEAGALLGISEKTAETHRANLMRKLGIHSVSEIVRYAIRNALIAP